LDDSKKKNGTHHLIISGNKVWKFGMGLYRNMGNYSKNGSNEKNHGKCQKIFHAKIKQGLGAHL
jgi:hypothetical protein